MLEMVLALPVLLFLLALLVNYGTVAAWKVRALTVSREMAWSTRWPRSGTTNPRPHYWPTTASVGVNGPGDVAELDVAAVNYPVVRGPNLMGTLVDGELLDPGRGLREGTADITREYPLLPSLGPYRKSATNELLDDAWPYPRMGLHRNRLRRLPVIYELARAPEGYASAYIQAAKAILYAPFRQALAPLDRDNEFRTYSLLWGDGSAPDFHPHLHGFCTLDTSTVAEHVTTLVDAERQGGCGTSVSNVPRCMAEAFIGLYQRVIAYYQSQPQVTPAMQAEIAQLQQRIAVLQQFLQTLDQASDGTEDGSANP